MNEKATTEFEIKVSGGQLLNAQVMPDGKCKLIIEVVAPNGVSTVDIQYGDTFVKVPASELCLDDAFMQYKPKTEKEQKFKDLLEEVIKSGLKDFWRPRYDPSFCEDGTKICFKPGKKPAGGKTYYWWKKKAREYKPDQGSRLGTKTEYIAFLAVLIKELIASGKSIEWAWNAVCNDSHELGHYWNSKDTRYALEDTGSRAVCGFYDLANTFKILAEDKESDDFWIAGGNFRSYSLSFPLAGLYRCTSRVDLGDYSCGWLVLEE